MKTPEDYVLLDSKQSMTTYPLYNDQKNWILSGKTKDECAEFCNGDPTCIGFNYSKNPTMYTGYTCSFSNVNEVKDTYGMDFYLKKNLSTSQSSTSQSSTSQSSTSQSSTSQSSTPSLSTLPSSTPDSPAGYNFNESKESTSTYPANNNALNWLLMGKTKEQCATICNGDSNCQGFNYSKNMEPYVGFTCSFSNSKDLKYSNNKNFYSKN
jgi:hypothetical protein